MAQLHCYLNKDSKCIVIIFFVKIMSPFLALRQACVHHNAVKGKYLTTKKPVSSMDNLLEALIEKNVLENEEYLRGLISTLNGKWMLKQNSGQFKFKFVYFF